MRVFSQDQRILRLAIIAIAAGLSSFSACHDPQDATTPIETLADSPEAIRVKAKPVELRKVGPAISALGRCDALPQKQAMLTPIIEGRVAAVMADLGDTVKANQPIIQLDTSLAKADVAEKQAARDSLVASLAAIQSRPRAEEQRVAKIAVNQADVALRRAESQVERLRPLRDHQEIAQAQVYEAEEAVKLAALQKDAAQAQLNVLMLSPRSEVTEEAKSKIKVADEALKTAAARVALQTISAPISGVITNLNCRIGQTVAVGASLAEVTDNRQVLVICWISPKWRDALRAGNVAQIQIRLPPSELKASNDPLLRLNGRVVVVGNSADSQTGNIPVHILVYNPDAKLLIGETLSVSIVLAGTAPTEYIPHEAVHDEEEGITVRVVRNGKAVIVHPTVGASDAEGVAVSNTDLKAGELVIVSGGYNLPDGTLVSVDSDDKATQPAAK
jgi:RND family efflux transporter MFP subunit